MRPRIRRGRLIESGSEGWSEKLARVNGLYNKIGGGKSKYGGTRLWIDILYSCAIVAIDRNERIIIAICSPRACDDPGGRLQRSSAPGNCPSPLIWHSHEQFYVRATAISSGRKWHRNLSRWTGRKTPIWPTRDHADYSSTAHPACLTPQRWQHRGYFQHSVEFSECCGNANLRCFRHPLRTNRQMGAICTRTGVEGGGGLDRLARVLAQSTIP